MNNVNYLVNSIYLSSYMIVCIRVSHVAVVVVVTITVPCMSLAVHFFTVRSYVYMYASAVCLLTLYWIDHTNIS